VCCHSAWSSRSARCAGGSESGDGRDKIGEEERDCIRTKTNSGPLRFGSGLA